MTKIDLARRIVKLNEEVTGEPASDKAAERLAARETTEALGKLLEDATKAAADKAGAGDEGEPAPDESDSLSGGDLEDQLDTALEQGDVADRDYDQHVDVADLDRVPDEAPPAKHDAWGAKPWLRPNVRVVLPALEPGESEEAPEGLPAERGTVQRIMGDAGTCIVVVDPVHRDGPDDDGERTVSIDDVELAPEPTLAGANAADKATKHAVDVRRMERKLELARGRAKRANDEVKRLEGRLERLKAGR